MKILIIFWKWLKSLFMKKETVINRVPKMQNPPLPPKKKPVKIEKPKRGINVPIKGTNQIVEI